MISEWFDRSFIIMEITKVATGSSASRDLRVISNPHMQLLIFCDLFPLYFKVLFTVSEARIRVFLRRIHLSRHTTANARISKAKISTISNLSNCGVATRRSSGINDAVSTTAKSTTSIFTGLIIFLLIRQELYLFFISIYSMFLRPKYL